MKNSINTNWDRTSDLPICVWLALHKAFYEKPRRYALTHERMDDEEFDTISVEQSALMANKWARENKILLGLHWKSSNLLPDFNQIWNLHVNSPISNFTKICPCESRDDPCGGQMDSRQGRRTGVKKERGAVRG